MGGRHGRTAVGMTMMALGIVAVLGSRWLEPMHVGCATSWVEVAHRYGFPTLLVLAGYQLFHRASFTELMQTASRVIRRRTP